MTVARRARTVDWRLWTVSQPAWSYVVHEHGGQRTAEVAADGIVVRSAADMLDMVGSVIWNDTADAIAVHEKNITPEFFDLSTGIAGDILQKCSNYQFRLAIMGDFDAYPSTSLQAFIRECNRGKHVLFVGSVRDALEMWGGA